MTSLFDVLANDDDSAQIAQRKSSAVATKRVKDRFGAFLANATDAADRQARLRLVNDDITTIVRDVVNEHGGNLDRINAAVKRAMDAPAPMGGPAPVGHTDPASLGASASCPVCGSPEVNGACPNGHSGNLAGDGQIGAPGADTTGTSMMGALPGQQQPGASQPGQQAPQPVGGMMDAIPQQPSTGQPQQKQQQYPLMSSTHEAKGGFCDTCHAWKSGPKAGCTCGGGESKTEERQGEQDVEKEASTHWSVDKSSLTLIEDTPITLRPGMNDGAALEDGAPPSDKYGQGLGQGLEGMGQQMGNAIQNVGTDATNPVGGALAGGVENMGQNMFGAPQPYHDPNMLPPSHMATSNQVSINTPPISHAEPLDEAGEGGVTDINGQLENAPTAVGHGTMASTTQKEAEALKTVKLPSGSKDGQGGPSPKIDKGKSGDENGWSLEPINTQMDGSPHPTEKQDIVVPADYSNEDFREHTDAVTKREKLKGNENGLGYSTERDQTLQKTKTFPKGNQAKPVTAGWERPYENDMYNYGVGNPLYDRADAQWQQRSGDPAKADQYFQHYRNMHDQMESGAVPADPQWKQWRESPEIGNQFGPRGGQGYPVTAAERPNYGTPEWQQDRDQTMSDPRVKAVYDWAHENYSNGADSIVEAVEPHELLEMIDRGGAQTPEDAIKYVQNLYGIRGGTGDDNVNVRHPDHPGGHNYRPIADQALTQAIQKRFEDFTPVVHHPTDPNTIIHNPGNFWDGPRHLTLNPNGGADYTNPYSGGTETIGGPAPAVDPDADHYDGRIGAVDPDKNPVRQILEQHDGALLPEQVQNALEGWNVG